MGSLPNGWELILVLLVVVVVFGSKRLPDSARALGRSMRILKSEAKGLKDDDAKRAGTTTTAEVTSVDGSPTAAAATVVPPTVTAPVAVTPVAVPQDAVAQPVQPGAVGQSRQP